MAGAQAADARLRMMMIRNGLGIRMMVRGPADSIARVLKSQ
jgi:hypothetical protein